MLSRWGEFDGTISALDQLRRRMDRIFEELEPGRFPTAWDGFGGLVAAWPRAGLRDAGESFVVTAEVAGLSENDVQITANQEGLTLSGERRVEAPSGYSVHRQERQSFSFSRAIAFPCKVDADKATATLKDGLLTVTVPKAPEAQPRRIAVKAS